VPRQPPAPTKTRGVRPPDKPAPARPPAPRSVAIPTPEELGIAAAPRREELDWAAARRQMQQLGVVRFEFEDLPGGRARFCCWVGSQKVQADGDGEAEAVRACLERARRQVALR